MLLAIHWSDTITLGSVLVGAFLGLAGMFTFAYGVRWKSAYEVAEATVQSLTEGREAFRLRSERLEEEVRELRAQMQVLEASRSLEPVLREVIEGFKHVNQAMELHDDRATERHEGLRESLKTHAAILQMIGDTFANLQQNCEEGAA